MLRTERALPKTILIGCYRFVTFPEKLLSLRNHIVTALFLIYSEDMIYYNHSNKKWFIQFPGSPGLKKTFSIFLLTFIFPKKRVPPGTRFLVSGGALLTSPAENGIIIL